MGKLFMYTQHPRSNKLCQTIYNEEWGQPKDNGASEDRFTKRVKELDPTRLVNTVSGWFDHGHGDFHVSCFTLSR